MEEDKRITSLDEIIPIQNPDLISNATPRPAAPGCPLFITNGFELANGTQFEIGYPGPYSREDYNGWGTTSVHLSADDTLLYVWDDLTWAEFYDGLEGRVPGQDERGWTVFTYPDLVYVERYPFATPQSPGIEVYPDTMTVDNDGNVYYWEERSTVDGTNRLYRQNGDSWSVIAEHVSPSTYYWGPALNPYNGYLYTFIDTIGTVGDPVTLIWHDTDGNLIGSEGGLYTESDYPTFTPDGGVWFSKRNPTLFQTPSGLYRYDSLTDTVDYRDFDEIPPIRSDAMPIPAEDSSVFYSNYDTDEGVRLFPGFTWESTGCLPFHDPDHVLSDYTMATARVSTSITGKTVFLYPSLNGTGFQLYEMSYNPSRGVARVADRQVKVTRYGKTVE